MHIEEELKTRRPDFAPSGNNARLPFLRREIDKRARYASEVRAEAIARFVGEAVMKMVRGKWIQHGLNVQASSIPKLFGERTAIERRIKSQRDGWLQPA